MIKFIRGEKIYWAGTHKKEGILIFDPASQEKVPPEKVRLWISSQQRMATFRKDLIKKFLIKGGSIDEKQRAVEEYVQALERAIDAYHKMLSNMRKTHCFKCRAHINSVDFSLCQKCKWIRCYCGACGCSYRGKGEL